MVPWGRLTRLRFRVGDMRFEVVFETPMMFLSSPENTRGPLRRKEICYIDGSDRSFAKSML